MRNLLLRFQAKVLLAVLLLISLLSNSQNQPWQEKMADPSVNIYEVKQSFDQAWQNRPVTKGKGYKQYKRWEYFMEARCFPTGVRFAPDAVYVAMEQQPEMFAFNSEMPGSWTYIGNTSVPSGGGGAGRVNGIRPMPGSTTTFFACAPAGGLWKTTNSGTSWSLMNTDGLASIGVSDVAIDPNNTNIMYIATGDGDAGDTYALGVLKTTDGGLTWNSTGLNWAVTNNRTTSRLLIDPSDSQKVIAATSNGIYRTTNGGASWTQVQTGSFKDLDFHPSNPLIVYATGASYYRSADGGATWSNITSGLPTSDVTRMALAVSADNASYVYILAGRSSDAGMRGVYRSTDAGLTFSAQYTGPLNLMGWDPSGTDSGGQAWYDLVIEADPNDADVIYTGGVNVWKSSNGGTSWAIAGHWYGGGAPYVHADIHAMSFVPGTSRLLVGCDGGVFTTTDGGPNFSDISSNLQIGQQYRLSVSQTNANLVLSGWQDNGTNLKNGATWTRPIGGDGMECIINPTNSNIMYGELYYGDIRKSTNGGVSFPTQVCSSGGTGVNEDGAWVTPYVLGSNPAHLYVGKTRVYKSTDNGATFTTLGAIPGNEINSLCVAPADNNYIYASKGGTLYRSTNNGTSFTVVSGLPGNYISYICTNSSNALEVYVTLSGFDSGVKVYKSTDAGSTWTNISGSLPNIPANCIVYQTGSVDNALYVGTDAGVYYRDDVLGNWVPYMNGMPNVVVDELEIQYGTSTIVAATFGRGTWSAPLYAIPQRDVTIVSIDSPTGTTCESLIAPSFTILNAGEDVVTSVTFSYQVDANPALTYTWTGTLASGGSATVTPPTYDYGNGSFTLNVSVTDVNGLGSDENVTNDVATTSYFVSGGANSVTLNLLTDCYPEETSWSVSQGGTVLFQGAGYAAQSNNSITMCLDDGCFTLTIDDSFGDGLSAVGCADGDYELINDANGAVLATMVTANFGDFATHNFCLNVPTPGCTDANACNYNASATTDDGSCVFGPVNDRCSTASNFVVDGGAVTVINTGTCFDGTEPGCGGAGEIKDVWYQFTFAGGDITIQTSAGSSAGVAALTDTRMAVYTSCGGTILECNDDISTTNYYSRIILTCAELTVGETYYVQVGGYNSNVGVCSLNITTTPIAGCTNPVAANFDFCATTDDGSCTGLDVFGCTNATACNYNAAATLDDGSCVLPTTYYRDLDNDTYGNAAQTIQACSPPVGYVLNSSDCNDNNSAIRPGATEVCNGIDDNCSGSTDEFLMQLYYEDADLDGYGNSAVQVMLCPGTAGYSSTGGDCDDSNALINPARVEVCNGIDDNCSGGIDEGLMILYYEDSDSDGYGNSAVQVMLCPGTAGYSSTGGDCDDSNALINPARVEVCNGIDDNCSGGIDEGLLVLYYEDADLDGYGNSAVQVMLCPGTAGYSSTGGDCDDSNALINPARVEVCNGIDDNCSGGIDEGLMLLYYEDSDLDGYGNSAVQVMLCPGTPGYSLTGGDCNDTNALINPDRAETCNGIDDNCSGGIDEFLMLLYYEDADLDGYGNSLIQVLVCPGTPGYSSTGGDCNDSNPAIRPDAAEFCNGIDDNCAGGIDEGLQITFYRDLDNDTYGNAAQTIQACTAPVGYVSNSLDCDDSNSGINPGATELCNTIDDDCDGTVDDNIVFVTYFADADSDGYGDIGNSIVSCTTVAGYVTNDQDCDDLNDMINPFAAELCNGADEDCDDIIDEGITLSTYYYDADLDGYGNPEVSIISCSIVPGYVFNQDDCDDGDASINPDSNEICDGLDQDCDGTADDGLTFTTYYFDADFDGYGNPLISTNSCSAVIGYVTNDDDCDDGNDDIHPGATELCNGVNDDCDGAIDEGCGTVFASNDEQANAMTIVPAVYPACTNAVGNLALASESEVGQGEDLWYSFVALTNAARITVIGSSGTNTEIEVIDINGLTVGAVEDATSTTGNEIFLSDELIIGNQYWIAVRNAGGLAGTFSVCVQALLASTCDNGPEFNNLTNRLKADWTGTSSYTAVLTSVSNPNNTYSFTSATTSWMTLSAFVGSINNETPGGLQYGESYSVEISSNYNLSDSGGNTGVYTAESTGSTCNITILSAPVINLNAAYASPSIGSNGRKPNSYVQTNIFVGGVVSYNWKFIAVDPLTNVPLNTELPIVVNSITSSRYIQLSAANIPGIAYGKRYRVMIQPVFTYGVGDFDNSSTIYLQITQSAGFVSEDKEAMLVEKMQENSIEFSSEIAIYPNPNDGSMFNINMICSEGGVWNLLIVDAFGKEVLSNYYTCNSGLNVVVTPQTKLAAGVYMVNLISENDMITTRFVVE